MMIREQERISLGQLMAAVLLLMAGALLFFYHLGKTEFTKETPARIALYAGQMNAQGQWVAPVLRGQARVDVPPLYLWSTRILSGLATTVTPFQERLPGALSALALVLLAAWWLYRHAERYSREDLANASPEGFALLAGLLLACNPALFSVGRAGTLHAMFVLFYAAAAFCWSESLEARRSFYAGRPWRTWVLWGYFFAGVAMLARGPLVLPLLWVPYWLAARTYHLRGIDWVHAAGLALALALGLSWPLAVTAVHHEAAAGLWRDWFSLRLGNLDSGEYAHEFLLHIVAASFPWNLLALVMIVRVWRRKDRSPTLVFWMCSLVGNVIVLTFLSSYVGQHRLPVVFFISLLAADAIYRWNFEHSAAVAWRVLLRVLLVAGILAGLAGALLLKSKLGLFLFLLIPLVWLAWAIRSRLVEVEYTPWETTLRLAAMLVCLLVAAEAMLLADYEPKRYIYSDKAAYIHRIADRLPDTNYQMLLQHGQMDVIYDYHFNVPPLLNKPVAALRSTKGQTIFLAADRDVRQLLGDANLDPLTLSWKKDHTVPDEGVFRVLGQTTETATSATQPGRSAKRLVLLGNQGTRAKDQRKVARRLDKYVDKRPADDALLLGNNVYGPSLLNHLDLIDSFEDPYHALLKRGITFHAALGHEDQDYARVQMAYPPFNMNGHRYYMFSAAMGLADVFVLDGERLHAGGKFDEPQLAWLADSLAKSRAPWKVVGLSQALASAVKGVKIDEDLSRRLLPLFDKNKVNFVAWAGGTWYERLALPGHTPVFLNGGWSGRNRDTEFATDPRLKFGYAERPGFAVLEFWSDRADLRAINDNGLQVERITVAPGGQVTVRPKFEETPAAATAKTAAAAAKAATATTAKVPGARGATPAPAAANPATTASKAR